MFFFLFCCFIGCFVVAGRKKIKTLTVCFVWFRFGFWHLENWLNCFALLLLRLLRGLRCSKRSTHVFILFVYMKYLSTRKVCLHLLCLGLRFDAGFGGKREEADWRLALLGGVSHTHTHTSVTAEGCCFVDVCFRSFVRLLTAAVKSSARWRASALLGTGQHDSRRTGTEGHRDHSRGGTIVTMVAPLQNVMEAPFPVDHGRTTELALRPRPSGSLEKEHREETR